MVESKIHLVRHGVTEWNDERRIQGSKDMTLSPEGIEQAAALVKEIDALGIDKIYTSTLSRAIQTAEIAISGQDIQIHSVPGLNERNFGEYEGMLLSEVEEIFGEGALDSRDPSGGETKEEFIQRVDSTFDELVSRHSDETLLIVSHGGVIQRLHERLSGISSEEGDIGYAIQNCLVYTFDLPTEFQR